MALMLSACGNQRHIVKQYHSFCPTDLHLHLQLMIINLFSFSEEKVGLDRSPLLSDRPNLPNLEAFILELFRHSSFLPFTIPHW